MACKLVARTNGPQTQTRQHYNSVPDETCTHGGRQGQPDEDDDDDDDDDDGGDDEGAVVPAPAPARDSEKDDMDDDDDDEEAKNGEGEVAKWKTIGKVSPILGHGAPNRTWRGT